MGKMLINNKIKLIVLLIMTINCSVCFSQEKDTASQRVFVEFKDITQKTIEKEAFLEKYVFPNIGPVLVLLGLIIGWCQLKKQIKATRSDILKKNNLEQTSLLINNIADLLSVLKDSKNVSNLSNYEYKSPEHYICEIRIVLLLDGNIPEEKDLITVLRKFLREGIKVSEWIEEIENKSKIVITKRLK